MQITHVKRIKNQSESVINVAMVANEADGNVTTGRHVGGMRFPGSAQVIR